MENRPCAFRCGADETGPIVHKPTGQTYHYCSEHAPDLDGEVWTIP